MRMLKFGKFAVLFILSFSLMLTACSDKIPNTPDDIEQGLWEDSYEIVNMTEDLVKKEEGKSKEQMDIVAIYNKKYFVDQETFDELSPYYTLREEVLILKVMFIIMSFEKDYFLQFGDEEFDFSNTLNEINDFYIFIETLN